jgi:hypothetical protein
MADRSQWQGFDASHELQRARSEPRDTVVVGADGGMTLKTIPRLVHERLMARPFRRLGDFGMESFVDYGRPYYDNNVGHDKGRNFPHAGRNNEKRERELERAREKEARATTLAAKLERN